MAYDQGGGHHSSMGFAEKVTAGLVGSTLDTRRSTLGLPFYGRLANSGEWETYEDLLARTDGAVARDGPGDDVAPARAGSTGTWSYNAPATIEAKTKLAKAAGLGGVMIWEAGQDCRLAPVSHRTSAKVHPRTCREDADSLLLAVTRGRVGAGSGGDEL